MTNDESIRVFDRVMLVLSRESIQSPWVEDEVQAVGFESRSLTGDCELSTVKFHSVRLVLFPVRLGDEVMGGQPGLGRQAAPHAAIRRLPPLERS